MFLQSLGMSGMEILNHEKVMQLELKNSIDYDKVDEHTKFLVFPIAVIGCGKTTTSVALTSLFPDSWGHIQNDDITGKDKSKLMKKSLELLADPNIKCVIVDRNNHQFRERKQLFEWLDELKEDYLPYDTNIKVIALSFASYDDLDKLKTLTVDRVLERGDAHQTIKVDQYGKAKVLGIMGGFWKRFQPIIEDKSPDNRFDLIIQLNSLQKDSSLMNVKTILKRLHDVYPILIPEIPSEESINIAFQKSLQYKPKMKERKVTNNETVSGTPKKKVRPAYFSVNIKDGTPIKELISNVIEKPSNISEDAQTILKNLLQNDNFQESFHITLAHVMQGKRGDPAEQELWKAYLKHYKKILKSYNDKEIPKLIETNDFVRFQPKMICWDDKIVSIVIKFPNDECVSDENGLLVTKLKCANKIPHITVARLQDNVKAVYSNTICKDVVENRDATNINHVELVDSPSLTGNVCINL